jgi:serine/threonine protein kinase
MPEELLDERYRLGDRIGSGGMGEVWRAYDQNLHREVAVKLITGLGHSHDPKAAARFVQEARAAARLSSQHIVTVYELGTARMGGGAAVPYLVMELLDGRPLDRLIHGGDGLPPLDDAARWAGQMCKALGTAHAAGVVHRDMKPANVLVVEGDAADREDSMVKVLDFGTARFLDSTSAPTTLTAVGSVVGTPAYMSPEQARGDVPVDERSDLYSLGCILYELVTGRLPFEASAWHVLLRKQMDEPPVPPRHLRPELPVDWEELILALLAKDPDDRPQTAGEVRSRLSALGDRAPTAPPLPPLPPHSRRPSGVDAEAGTRTAPALPRTAPAGPEPVRAPTQVDSVAPQPPLRAPIRVDSRKPPMAASTRPQSRATSPSAPPPRPASVGRPVPTGVVVAVLAVVALFLPWWATLPLVIAAVAWVFTVNRRGASSQQDHPPRGHFYQGKHR